jgi:hypothetical protein
MKEEAIVNEKLQYEEDKGYNDPEPQVVLNEEDDSPIEEVRVTVSSKYLISLDVIDVQCSATN